MSSTEEGLVSNRLSYTVESMFLFVGVKFKFGAKEEGIFIKPAGVLISAHFNVFENSVLYWHLVAALDSFTGEKNL